MKNPRKPLTEPAADMTFRENYGAIVDSKAFDGHCGSSSGPVTQGSNPRFFVPLMECVDERRENPSAAAANRMAKSYGSAVHVELIGIDTQNLGHQSVVNCKRFIVLEQIDVIDVLLNFS